MASRAPAGDPTSASLVLPETAAAMIGLATVGAFPAVKGVGGCEDSGPARRKGGVWGGDAGAVATDAW